jgi:hypothetical protein
VIVSVRLMTPSSVASTPPRGHGAGGEVVDDRAGRQVDDDDVVVLLQRDDRTVAGVDVDELPVPGRRVHSRRGTWDVVGAFVRWARVLLL